MVQINDKILQLPISLSDLEALGFDYEIFDQSKDYLFAEGDDKNVQFYLEGEQLFNEVITSDMEGFHTLEEINPMITEITLYNLQMSDKAKALFDIYFPGGIQLGDSYTVIEEKLGKPYEIDRDMKYMYGADDRIRLYFFNDKDTHVISSVSMYKKINPVNIDDLATMTIEDVGYGEIKPDLTLQFWSEHMKSMETTHSYIVHESALYDISILFGLESENNYYELLEETLYEVTQEDGTYRMIGKGFDDDIQLCVKKDGYVLTGIVHIDNCSENVEEDYYELFSDKLIEIVNSMDFTY